MNAAAWIVGLVEVYAGLGVVVAAAFLLWGIERVDPAARGTYLFRPLLVPGTVLLWPLILKRWRALERSKE